MNNDTLTLTKSVDLKSNLEQKQKKRPKTKGAYARYHLFHPTYSKNRTLIMTVTASGTFSVCFPEGSNHFRFLPSPFL